MAVCNLCKADIRTQSDAYLCKIYCCFACNLICLVVVWVYFLRASCHVFCGVFHNLVSCGVVVNCVAVCSSMMTFLFFMGQFWGNFEC